MNDFLEKRCGNCKDCHYQSGECNDCYFEHSKECPEYSEKMKEESEDDGTA